MTPRRAGAAAVAVSCLALFTACGGSEEPAPVAEEEQVEMACDTIIPGTLASDLVDLGWSWIEEPFRIGEHLIDAGIQCVWGDYESGTDIAQMYGWAPLDDGQDVEMQDYLESQGWIREEENGRVLLTENPETAMYVNDDGYGMTYRFSDHDVVVADTKSGLDLVIWNS